MSAEQQEPCEELETLDTSLSFLLLVIASVVLSYIALARQRKALCLTIEGNTAYAEEVGQVYPLRFSASALIVGALGYFFCLTLQTYRDADPCDPVALHSANLNALAGFLVLLASLIRLFNLNFTQRAQSALTGELLPD